MYSENIDCIINGYQSFKKVEFKAQESDFKNLVDGQNPKALFIGCSDSRVVPELITGSKPGDLFITRNIGNLVPLFTEESFHATAAVIEYAVSNLKVSDIIVCGHSHCGAIEHLFHDDIETEENHHLLQWLSLAEPAKKIALLSHANSSKEELCRFTEKLSVLFQLQNLISYPAVKRGLEDGTLHIHGWYYDIETGEIESYSDDNYKFRPLEKSND